MKRGPRQWPALLSVHSSLGRALAPAPAGGSRHPLCPGSARLAGTETASRFQRCPAHLRKRQHRDPASSRGSLVPGCSTLPGRLSAAGGPGVALVRPPSWRGAGGDALAAGIPTHAAPRVTGRGVGRRRLKGPGDFGAVTRGVVPSPSRIKQLAEALRTNRSVQSLFLHGSPLTDAGLALLNPALALHPALVALDLGDCMLGDEAINLICGLLPPDGAKSGLKELTLSANPGITPKGWSRLAIAVAHSSQVRVLNLDYNPLGDHVAGMLAVAVASSRTLEVLDLEGTGLTNQSAQEGEEEEEVAGGAGDTQEWEKGREPAAHQRGSSSWMCPSDPSSQMVLMTSGLGDSLLAETEM
ncbi:leucine-rich repeat-containing protein 73 [Carlito syrichta]|uniref:Leucine-rich repeat-containing protein 73 n=1 Tax=Carlito syrichta TaxID=1868482 RepID=A0A3Q0E769_CARSF|nr:leucine-rich repeat-containing protein 73 [Carlito syrichta]